MGLFLVFKGCLSPMTLPVYGICGSRNYRRFGRRATDVKKGNAGPKLHWCLWDKSGLLYLTLDPYV